MLARAFAHASAAAARISGSRAATRASTSPGGVSTPVTPSSTTKSAAPARAATSAAPEDIASISVSPKPSLREVKATAARALRCRARARSLGDQPPEDPRATGTPWDDPGVRRGEPGPAGGRPAALFRFRARQLEVTDQFAVLRPPGTVDRCAASPSSAARSEATSLRNPAAPDSSTGTSIARLPTTIPSARARGLGCLLGRRDAEACEQGGVGHRAGARVTRAGSCEERTALAPVVPVTDDEIGPAVGELDAREANGRGRGRRRGELEAAAARGEPPTGTSARTRLAAPASRAPAGKCSGPYCPRRTRRSSGKRARGRRRRPLSARTRGRRWYACPGERRVAAPAG